MEVVAPWQAVWQAHESARCVVVFHHEAYSLVYLTCTTFMYPDLKEPIPCRISVQSSTTARQ